MESYSKTSALFGLCITTTLDTSLCVCVCVKKGATRSTDTWRNEKGIDSDDGRTPTRLQGLIDVVCCLKRRTQFTGPCQATLYLGRSKTRAGYPKRDTWPIEREQKTPGRDLIRSFVVIFFGCAFLVNMAGWKEEMNRSTTWRRRKSPAQKKITKEKSNCSAAATDSQMDTVRAKKASLFWIRDLITKKSNNNSYDIYQEHRGM